MSRFVHLLRTRDIRYAAGAAVSWLIYGALYIAMLEIFGGHYAAASGISWILSYGVVYAFQRYGTFGAMNREAMFREAICCRRRRSERCSQLRTRDGARKL